MPVYDCMGQQPAGVATYIHIGADARARERAGIWPPLYYSRYVHTRRHRGGSRNFLCRSQRPLPAHTVARRAPFREQHIQTVTTYTVDAALDRKSSEPRFRRHHHRERRKQLDTPRRENDIQPRPAVARSQHKPPATILALLGSSGNPPGHR